MMAETVYFDCAGRDVNGKRKRMDADEEDGG
jgi:hypothetical protein